MLTFLLLAAAAAPDAKTMAMDDWHALAITGVAGEASGPLYLKVQAGDLDGDGTADDAVLRLVCAVGKVTNASYVISPRDSASGMATGKRQYAPVKIVKEWGAASPELSKIKPQYDVKAMKGNERMADGWTAISLANADGLCGATQAAAAAVVKSKSNITNN
ncbi:hypothetical protein [Sphingomonas sp.]|uniref:hypothetical protein n=1 Tax=Sphingomonas sp. TaxID=28214 RepID=UPI0038A54925